MNGEMRNANGILVGKTGRNKKAAEGNVLTD
jgi:hypothetical protein